MYSRAQMAVPVHAIGEDVVQKSTMPTRDPCKTPVEKLKMKIRHSFKYADFNLSRFV
jgi:hypothetical protein